MKGSIYSLNQLFFSHKYKATIGDLYLIIHYNKYKEKVHKKKASLKKHGSFYLYDLNA